MPQFDMVSNYFILFYFFVLFFLYYISYISFVNTLLKFAKINLIIKEHKKNLNIYKNFMLGLTLKIKNWILKLSI